MKRMKKGEFYIVRFIIKERYQASFFIINPLKVVCDKVLINGAYITLIEKGHKTLSIYVKWDQMEIIGHLNKAQMIMEMI